MTATPAAELKQAAALIRAGRAPEPVSLSSQFPHLDEAAAQLMEQAAMLLDYTPAAEELLTVSQALTLARQILGTPAAKEAHDA